MLLFFFNDTATTEIYTLSLHDALPIYRALHSSWRTFLGHYKNQILACDFFTLEMVWLQTIYVLFCIEVGSRRVQDRKSTRLNSSHANISYAVFCLKKKNISLPALPISF